MRLRIFLRTILSVYIIVLFVFASGLLIGQTLHAGDNTVQNPLGVNTTLITIIQRFTTLAQLLVGPLSILMILIAGFLYMTAGGSEERLKTAHKMLIWAVIGIALVLLASSACLIISSVLGGSSSGSCTP